MITLESFLQNQRGIIERDFVNSRIKTEGTCPTDYMEAGRVRVEYGALLRHPDHIAETVEEFSRRISSLVPSLYCPAADVHTGLVNYDGTEDKETVLRKLTEATHKGLKDFRSPYMTYDGWYYNQDTVIVAGGTSEHFIDIANSMLANYVGKGLRIKWASQITANRFTEKRSPEELREFFELMKKAPQLGLSRPTVLDIISQTISKTGSTIEVYERFAIPL